MEVFIIGSGGNSKIVIDICEQLNHKILGIFDDKFNGSTIEVYKNNKIINNIDSIKNYGTINIINSIGDCQAKYKIYAKLQNLPLNWINIIHPNSVISSSVKMGIGNIVCLGAIINCDAEIGDHNLINTCSIIEHDCKIGKFNHFAPKTTLCGGVIVGDLNLIGVGSSIIPLKIIGNSNKIGGMSMIINNFDNDNTIVGVPAKIKKNNNVL